MSNEKPIVYLVDDDPAVLKALSRMLRANGLETESYGCPSRFLEMHDDERPGCVVLDLAMPEFDGMELQRRLAASGSSRPIIFLTGRADLPTGIEAMKSGAIDFLTKPVDSDALVGAVRRAIEADLAERRARAETASLQARLSALSRRRSGAGGGWQSTSRLQRRWASQKTVIHRAG